MKKYVPLHRVFYAVSLAAFTTAIILTLMHKGSQADFLGIVTYIALVFGLVGETVSFFASIKRQT